MLYVDVEFSEAVLDLLRIHLIMLAIGIPEHFQNGLDVAVAVVERIGFNIAQWTVLCVPCVADCCEDFSQSFSPADGISPGSGEIWIGKGEGRQFCEDLF